MKNLVVLSGAGISAESGISTFRDSNGLWENHRIEEVASPEGFNQNPELVLDFYNKRRQQLLKVEPNSAHLLLKKLEEKYTVEIITQNVDDLHERAGSENVTHLHGELLKVRSTQNENLVYDWKKDLKLGDLAEDNAQLRPHIVWFGEMVPMIERAISICKKADILLIIGTSMQVYPAAQLYTYVPDNCAIFVINPDENSMPLQSNITYINKSATQGMKEWVEVLNI